MKLSHSSVQKYSECGKMYKLHYVDKIRPIVEPAHFSFGSSTDHAISALLVPGKKTAEEVFLEEWKKAPSNIKFSKSDMDLNLLSEEEIIACNNDISALSRKSLEHKGLIMIRSFREKILPNIEKVYGVQIPIELKNQDNSGDTFIGFVDFVLQYKGYNNPIIGDLKTSTTRYDADSVKTSQQLTVYTYALEDTYKTRTAGYWVIDKKIRRNLHQTCEKCGNKEFNSRAANCNKGTGKNRCSGVWNIITTFEADIRVIIDEIPPSQENDILNLIDKTHENIKAGNFEPNHESCISKKYHTKCPFYDWCHNDSMEGLVKKS